MKSLEELKKIVQDKYAGIALQDRATNAASCCGSTTASCEVYNIMSDSYTELEGYTPDADLGLGCGLPTQFAKIQEGDVVVDLGSGAGNDAFIARHETGEKGKVIGIDFTPQMIERAKINAATRGYTNVEFREGDIENMPLASGIADVVVSNCVLNLVPGKENVLKEIYRVLKPEGHFSISDIVLKGKLPVNIQNAAEMYAGCVSGAIQRDEYLAMIQKTGFTNITIQKEKLIYLPDDILREYLTAAELKEFRNSQTGIVSVTVYAEKPKACCGPDCC